MSGYACVDASVVVKWLLTEDDSASAIALAEKLRSEAVTLIAPPHMPIEVVNVIRVRVLRGELTQVEGDDLVDVFTALPIEIASPAGIYRKALDLANRYGRPNVYDTHYVALAELAGCDFWTADMRLVNALNGRLPFVRALSSFVP